MAKVKIAKFNEVPEGELKKVMVGDLPIAIFKISGQVYATSNICPHASCFLDENHQMHNDVVECTGHGSQFDIRTGDVILPPAVEKLKTYRTEVLENDIWISID